jgi:aspartyl-tRNA(Asn)/glutamyl-tRNA(Gln) amidotransferase subunit A
MSAVTTARERLAAGVSAATLADEALARLDGDRCNAVIRRDEALLRAAAARLDARWAAGERPPLAGVPVLLKDNILRRGATATACSRMLAGFTAPYDATATARLEAAGALIVGGANMDEFAMGSSNETSAFGPVRNPHAADRVPGGSSGGSAAAVGAGLVPLALGSDTGGSIRQPAAFCGCIGLKPTYGRVSRYGLIAYGSSLDQIGPLATNLDDARACLQAIAGADDHDATCAPRDISDLAARPLADLRGLRVGIVAAHREQLTGAPAAALDQSIAAARAAGATIVEVALPHEQHAVPAYYIVATGEASSNLSRFDGVRYGHRTAEMGDLEQLYARSRGEGFGREVQRRILLGTYVLSAGYYDAYYRQAMRVRQLIAGDFRNAFAACEVLLGPVSPVQPWRFGDKSSDPVQMYLADLFTLGANLAGVPALSLPVGRDTDGLPTAVQLHGPHWSEGRLLDVAERLTSTLKDG